MGLPNRICLYLQTEDIATVEDLCDFIKTGSWTQSLDNYKRLPQVMVASVLVNQPAFKLPAKSLVRFKVAAQAVEYYLDTGRALSAAGILWTNLLCNFQAEKESLDEKKKNQSNLELPVTSNTLKIIDWFEAFDICCNTYIGQPRTPFNLVSRLLVTASAVAPPLGADQPFSTE